MTRIIAQRRPLTPDAKHRRSAMPFALSDDGPLGRILTDACGARRFEAVGIGPSLLTAGGWNGHVRRLLSFTDKGIQGIKDTTKRAVAAREVAKKFGVTIREMLWTMGKYDLVCVLEAEDEEALAAFNLATAMQGNLRSHSLRAYSAGEMDKILAKLP